MFSARVKELFQQRYGHTFVDSDPTFNAGVYGVNLDLWRARDVHAEVTFWMEKVCVRSELSPGQCLKLVVSLVPYTASSGLNSCLFTVH